MKLYLVGGSVIEVSDKEYILVITPEKAGFNRIREEGKDWPYCTVGEFEDYVFPRSIVEKVIL